MGRLSVDAYLGLGSNQGDSEALLVGALSQLPDVVAVSGLYRSAPIGGPEQPPFLNLVAQLRTALTPEELLAACQQVEQAAGRVRTVRWGPRTLDVDVLLYGERAINTPTLTVPHPRMFERRFVVDPLAELAPHLITAAQRQVVAQQECERVASVPWPPS